MPQLSEKSEAEIIEHWSLLDEREALLFFRDIGDRIWFNSNPSRKLRVRPVEPVEIAMLTAFEKLKLRKDAGLREQASWKSVIPEMMIVIKVGDGRVPYRPLPILPHIATTDTDVWAAEYLLAYWNDERSRFFICDERKISVARDICIDGRRPGFRKEREPGTLRLPWAQGPEASSGLASPPPDWPAA